MFGLGFCSMAGMDDSWVAVVVASYLVTATSFTLHDTNVIGKYVTTSFYGRQPDYSYWSSCSNGGRQGLALAQRYPGDYDGILALAPAINWPEFLVALYWGQTVMGQLNVFPRPCEFHAITAAAIEACDQLDGLEDGIISAPGLCDFDPTTLVGKQFTCEDTPTVFTEEAAKIAASVWKGVPQWYGLNHGAALSDGIGSMVATLCSTPTSTDCAAFSFILSPFWLSLFVFEDVNYNVQDLTPGESFDAAFNQSVSKFRQILGNNDPDLSAFAAAGGKMITWHGVDDPVIFANGTSEYHKNVLLQDPAARDYYRYFEVPGTGHCVPGKGPYPTDVLSDLMDWVENRIAPEVLNGVAKDMTTGAVVGSRNLCQWPLVAKYIGGDANVKDSFVCVESY